MYYITTLTSADISSYMVASRRPLFQHLICPPVAQATHMIHCTAPEGTNTEKFYRINYSGSISVL